MDFFSIFFRISNSLWVAFSGNWSCPWSQVLHDVRTDQCPFGLQRHRNAGRGGVQRPPGERDNGLRRVPAGGDEARSGHAVSRPRRRPPADPLEGGDAARLPRPLGDDVETRRLPLQRAESDQLHSRLNAAANSHRPTYERRGLDRRIESVSGGVNWLLLTSTSITGVTNQPGSLENIKSLEFVL